MTLFAERFDFRLQTVYTFGLSISLVAVALLLSMLFRRRRRPFGAHVVFALHYVAFLYSAGLLVGVARRIFAMPPLLNVAFAYVIIGPYLVLRCAACMPNRCRGHFSRPSCSPR